MTQEKAKRYDEALEIAKKNYITAQDLCEGSQIGVECFKNTLENIFPELKESEDERILELIKKYVHYNISDMVLNADHITREQLEDWLENQSKKEYALKSFKDEDVRKFMQRIEKEAKAYDINLPNRSYDIYAFAKDLLSWLEKQGKETSWKPSKEEMDVLYGLAYITNKYDEHKEEVITRLYQDLKREFFNGSSYENMFPNTEDGVRRRSTIQVLEYARSLDNYNQYGKADIDKNIAWLEKQGEQFDDNIINSSDERIRKAILEGLIDCRDAPDLGWSNFGGIEIDDCIAWLEKQGEQKPQGKTALEDIKEEKIDNQNCVKPTNKVEPIFKVGDWVVNRFGDVWHIDSFDKKNYQVSDGNGYYSYFPISVQDKMHLWTIQDAKDGDVLFHLDSASNGIFIFKEILQRGTIQKVICYCDYDSEDGFCLGENHTCCWTDSKILHPATKEQRDTLFQKMKEAGYEWMVIGKN